MGELRWFLIGFVVLYIIWFVGGGPSRNDVNRTHPFIEEPYSGGKIYTIEDLKNR